MTDRAVSRRIRRRMLAVTAAVVVAGAALVGCSSDEGSGGADSVTQQIGAGQSGPVDPARIDAMMLTGDALPAGYQEQPVPKDQLGEILDQLTGTIGDADIEPAICGDLSAMPDEINPDETGMLVGIRGSNPQDVQSIAIVISTFGTDIAEARDTVEQCGELSATFAVEGQEVSSVAQTTEITVPRSDGAETFAFAQDTQTSLTGGPTMQSQSVVGYAQVGGYFLTVQFMSMGGDVDRSEFERVFTEAVDKAVANA